MQNSEFDHESWLGSCNLDAIFCRFSRLCRDYFQGLGCFNRRFGEKIKDLDDFETGCVVIFFLKQK